MKTQISALDLHYLLSEMQFLVGARVDKVYHPEKEEVLLQFHAPGKGKHLLRVFVGKFLFLSKHKGAQKEPGGFCMFLRKHVQGARIRAIEQMGSERVLKFLIERKEDKVYLYIELFGKGNMILTKEDDVIINALQQKKWADRQIMKHQVYKFPKKDHNFMTIKKDEFFPLLVSDKELVYKLSNDLGLGGLYSEEVISLSKIDKKKKKLSEQEKDMVWKAFKKLLKREIGAKIIRAKEEIKDMIPFSLSKYEKTEQESINTFNEAFDAWYATIKKSDAFVSKHQKAIDKAKAIVEQQEKQYNILEKKAKDANLKGEQIYEKYQLLSEIFSQIKKARKTFSFKEIKEKLKGHKIISDIDPKTKKIKVKL